jgi:ABC-type multidrug transport system permease subunit
MNYKLQSKYWLSILLSLTAFILIIFTWTPLFSVAYNFISRPQNNSLGIPTGVVGINYSISLIMWFIASIVILMIIFFLFGKKKNNISSSFWINSIALSFIISHVILWIFYIHPF